MNKFEKYADDAFVILGILVLLGTTYYLNWVVANYILSSMLIFTGFLFAKRNNKY